MIIVWLSSSPEHVVTRASSPVPDLLVSHNNGPPCSPRSCSDRAFQNFPIRPVFFGQCFDMRISFDKRTSNIYGTYRQNGRSIRQTYRFSPHFNIPSRQTSCSTKLAQSWRNSASLKVLLCFTTVLWTSQK